MTTKRKTLTDAVVKARAKRPGLHRVSNCLYLQVTEGLTASWIIRFYMPGEKTPKSMGGGGYPETPLKVANAVRDEALRLRDAGINPIEARRGKLRALSTATTVKQACEAYLTAQRARFRTERHVRQMQQRLRDFVYPAIGHLPIAAIKGAEARLVLSSIWQSKHKTASRVRQYMEDTTNWATHAGVRPEELPNPWETKRTQWDFPLGIHKTRSHASLPFEQAPAFLAELQQQQPSVKSLALQFVILNAIRVGDIVGGGKAHSTPMCWSHVDLVGKVWTIPDTKMSKPHIVPLSDAAMRVLAEMQRFRDPESDFVFAGAKNGSCLNDATLRYLIADMGYGGEVTVHGFRATFRTWAAENTAFEKGVIEAALAHAQGELDSAYHRGSYLQKRAQLMQLWASYLAGEPVKATGEVLVLRRA
jgi:integrase